MPIQAAPGPARLSLAFCRSGSYFVGGRFMAPAHHIYRCLPARAELSWLGQRSFRVPAQPSTRREDAVQLASSSQRSDPHDHGTPTHDDSNCSIHRLLHVAKLSVGWVPLLVCLGLFVAFLSELPATAPVRRLVIRLDCRGPPAC